MTASVTHRSTFRALAAEGDRRRHGPVHVRSLPADHRAMQPGASLALAFAFQRRFGTAVERNRARRRLRAAFVDAGGTHCRGAVLMSGRRGVLDRPYPELVDDVRGCIAHLRFEQPADLDTVRSSAEDRRSADR